MSGGIFLLQSEGNLVEMMRACLKDFEAVAYEVLRTGGLKRG
jgi:hypothetical protein